MKKLLSKAKAEYNFRATDEFWLIIDREDREKILENEKVCVKHNYIDLYLADCIGDGRGYTKRHKASVFMPKVKVAVENARKIRDLGERIPGGLSTDVYKLVEKLIK